MCEKLHRCVGSCTIVWKAASLCEKLNLCVGICAVVWELCHRVGICAIV
ncbi:hypothetical protein [Bacteroides pyogenes]|nr:hypothetical protein [Bacteroides pyogenes]MCE9106714.1 hypothetical protein [Bacteroides pyogenes]